jgi:hypothetical protein
MVLVDVILTRTRHQIVVKIFSMLACALMLRLNSGNIGSMEDQKTKGTAAPA